MGWAARRYRGASDVHPHWSARGLRWWLPADQPYGKHNADGRKGTVLRRLQGSAALTTNHGSGTKAPSTIHDPDLAAPMWYGDDEFGGAWHVYIAPTFPDLTGWTEATVCGWVKWGTQTEAPWSLLSGDTANPPAWDFAGDHYWTTLLSARRSWNWAAKGLTPTALTYVAYTWRASDTTREHMWQRDVGLVATDSVAGAATMQNAITNVIGGDGLNTTWVESHRLADLRLYDRVLTPGQIESLATGEWRVMNAPSRRTYFIPAAAGLTPDITTGVEFDGTNDYLTRGGGLTGAVDGQFGTLSFWLKTAQSGSARIFGGATSAFVVALTTGGKIQLLVRNAASENLVNILGATSVNDDAWHHVLAAWDENVGVAALYVDDVVDDTDDTATAREADYTQPDWAVGALTDGTIKLTGCLAEIYFALEYVGALSTESNRRKFYSASGEPVSLGNDGSTPTGTQPILYLSGGASQFAHNFGSGGSFTVNGALVDCAIEVGNTITATLSIGAAIQAQRTLSANLSAAIQQQRTATASVDAAVAQALNALVSANAAVQATNTASLSLDAALRAAQSATADVDAVIQAAQTAAVSLQGAVQTERTSSAQIGAAVQALITAQASLEGLIQATITATTGLSASITEPGVNLATAALSGAIRALQSASVGLSVAIQGAGSVETALQAGIAAVQLVTATIDAAIAQIVTATPSVDGAILATMSATASLNARITALSSFSPSLDRIHTAGQASRIHTQGGQSRTHTVPARTRRH